MQMWNFRCESGATIRSWGLRQHPLTVERPLHIVTVVPLCRIPVRYTVTVPLVFGHYMPWPPLFNEIDMCDFNSTCPSIFINYALYINNLNSSTCSSLHSKQSCPWHFPACRRSKRMWQYTYSDVEDRGDDACDSPYSVMPMTLQSFISQGRKLLLPSQAADWRVFLRRWHAWQFDVWW